ncbi:MAG: polyprenyl synthetase family protein [Firmicutes bacterium]|nr:polyprenyl synthetase family protein [Bacillota bacterium]
MSTIKTSQKLHKLLPLFYDLTADALRETEEYIRSLLRSENKEIEESALYLLDSGGKRLRPGLLLLSGHCGHYDKDKLIPIAAAVEIIHMASLVHDDIVDDSPLRRGKPTIAKAKGKRTALITGNFMLAKAIETVLSLDDTRVKQIALDTAKEMCRGEFDQLKVRQTPDFTREHYIDRVKQKTANLLSAACETGAYLSGADEATVTAMKRFGEKIGIAFQITDDILDYTANTEKFGKVIGRDIMDGLATMPLICAWEKGNEREMIRQLFRQCRSEENSVKELIAAVEANEGTKTAAKIAEQYITEAKAEIQIIQNDEIRAAFTEIADFILSRQH